MLRDQQSDSSAARISSRQAQRARSFWDASYDNGVDELEHDGGSCSAHTEWIVSPSDVLRFLPTHARTLRVLEIGCGDSLLGEAIYDHLARLANDRGSGTQEAATEKPEQHVAVVCTDISPVAIGRLVARQEREDAERRRRPGLQYLVADATDLPLTFGITGDRKGHDKHGEKNTGEGEEQGGDCRQGFRYGEYHKQGLGASQTAHPAPAAEAAEAADSAPLEPLRNLLFDVVVDKGCADTFQFRGKTSESDGLLRSLFRSVHAVLRPGGAYLVVTPRKKVKHLRSWGWDSDFPRGSRSDGGGGGGTSGFDERTATEGGSGAGSGCCATLGWASQRRHDLGVVGSGELVRKMKEKALGHDTGDGEEEGGEEEAIVCGSGGHRVYLHECVKRTAEQEATLALEGMGAGIGDGCRGRSDGLPPRCVQCGLEREQSRYKNTKSWSGHLDWCQGPC